MSNIPSTGFLSNLQERNQRNLVEILRAAEPVMEEIAKVKPESWRNMRGLFTALEGTFGVSQIGAGALTPRNMMRNMTNNMFQGILAPVMVGLNSLSNRVEAFALQYQTGATGGAIAGGILGIFVGNPTLGSIFGALVGAGFEALLTNPDPRDRGGAGYYPVDEDVMSQFSWWNQEDPTDRIRNWMNYDAGFASNINPVSRDFSMYYRIITGRGITQVNRQGGR